MGTSSPFEGQSGDKPLVPSFVGDEGSPPSARPDPEDEDANGDGNADGGEADDDGPAQPQPLPPPGDPTRFTSARTSFTEFAKSGGSDRRSLGRAVSRYVNSTTGGARPAAARMGSSRGAAGRLASFLATVSAQGAAEALRALDLGSLAGRPIEEVFLGLMDYICPDGGSIDEGIARDAFIETIAQLAAEGIADLDAITSAQMQTVFELYATNAIEARLCNDIGMKTVTMPSSPRDAARVQRQLHDFIRRSVADALTVVRTAVAALTPQRVLAFVGTVYEQAFGILRDMGEAAAESAA